MSAAEVFKQGVDELVFAHGTRVILEQLADVQQEHRLSRRVDVAFHERDANGGGVEHGHRQARLRQLVQGGAQEGHVACNDEHGSQRSRQEPPARIMGAHERRQVHDELVLARLELNRIVGLRLGDRLRVDRAKAAEHVRAARGVVLDRHLPDAAI